MEILALWFTYYLGGLLSGGQSSRLLGVLFCFDSFKRNWLHTLSELGAFGASYGGDIPDICRPKGYLGFGHGRSAQISVQMFDLAGPGC